MSDTYTQFVNSPVGKQVASRLGIPRPVSLRRYTPGGPLVDGPVVVAGYGDAPVAKRITAMLDAEGLSTLSETPGSGRVAAVVADLSAATSPEHLETLRAIIAPALKVLAPSGRVLVIGASSDEAGTDPALGAVRRSLAGIVRSIGKELRGGATANLVLVQDGGEVNVDAAVRFFLSGRSAYVDAQIVSVGPLTTGVAPAPADQARPLQGKVAVVTGAARGIGASIADVLTRDGATVVCVDLPQAGEALATVANRNGGSALQLDVTSPDAGARIVEHARTRHGGLDIVVHNAGITRDRLLANTDAARWHSVLDVNLLSVLRMDEALLAPGALDDGGHVVVLSSMSGIAGNRGQSNYAASKAGLIGMVEALGRDTDLRERGITVNAVAPGFIETEMTSKIPFATREMGRRINSLAQGGLPVDVAETIAWFSQDANAGVTGQVLRVCGQSMLGA
ncbi:3-oxoacyl-ACP reductase [Dermatophilaceae bacterium Soc4.6]